MAGGTGGHIYPALAVARHLAGCGWRVVWLGTRAGLEAKVVPAHGFPIEWLSVAGLRRKGWLSKFLLPTMLLVAFYQAARAIFRHRPDVVLGLGGYASFPGGMMAVLLEVPLVIHEQNAIAGLANRVLACLADRVLVGFPQAFSGEKDRPLPCGRVKTVHTGNPVRPEIAALADPEARYTRRDGPLSLLVVGGSLGAQPLNEVVPEALARLPREARPRVLHQTGERHFEAVKARYEALGLSSVASVRLVPFIEDMAAAYGEADVVLCRAGALTIAELAAAGVASILVPYPHAVDDHQTANARFLADAGGALFLPQAELTAERLAALIAETSRTRALAMAKKARRVAKPRATAEVAAVLEALAA